MDTEQQIRLNFLEEVQDYFHQIEGVVLELTQIPTAQQLDAAMRAAHSVKGGAAMMGFMPLSQTAHRMEDFLKILRLHQDPQQMTTEVETLLLQGIDALRAISHLHQQGTGVTEAWLNAQVDPIFIQLQDRLGELREEDEDALLAQEEQVDVSTIVFTSGVEDCLDGFEQQMGYLNPSQLQEEIRATAEQLAEFGRMSELDEFVSLCQAIQSQVQQIPLSQVQTYAQKVLEIWRRSHALVVLGRTDQLPTTLTFAELLSADLSSDSFPESSLEADFVDFDRIPTTGSSPENLSLDDIQLDNIQLDNIQLDNIQLDDISLDDIELDDIQLDDISLDNIQLGDIQLDTIQLDAIQPDNVQLSNAQLDEFEHAVQVDDAQDDAQLDDVEDNVENEPLDDFRNVQLGNDVPTVRLEDAQLENVELENIELENVELENVELENIELENIELENIELENIELENIELENVELENVELENVELENVELENVELENVELENVELENVELNVIVENLPLDDVQLNDIENVHLENAQLENAQLENIQLENVELNVVENLPLDDVQLNDIENVHLENAQLENAQLENSQMENLQLENLQLGDGDIEFDNVFLENTQTDRDRWHESRPELLEPMLTVIASEGLEHDRQESPFDTIDLDSVQNDPQENLFDTIEPASVQFEDIPLENVPLFDNLEPESVPDEQEQPVAFFDVVPPGQPRTSVPTPSPDSPPLTLGIEDLANQFENPIDPQILDQTLQQTIPFLVPQQPSSATVRVSVQQLQKINTLFGELIIERNAVNLRLSQMQQYMALMQQRMRQLEQSNTQLRQWYDRASLEFTTEFTTSEFTTSSPQKPASPPSPASPVSDQSQTPLSQPSQGTTFPSQTATRSLTTTAAQEYTQAFDALELDRYTDLHLLSQDQMETIVQLQEVFADIELSLREMGQATGDLNYTTQALQNNITRTQMRPFADVVSRFPRVVRDLSLQYGKQVQLKLEGENTLLDRVTLEALTDPLNHLLRNAFDHGIEDPETRQAMGKSPQGTISLRALHRGNQTIITMQDDGRGINLQKIRDRLAQMGVTEAEMSQLRERDLLNFIFEPGFSTASQVTELSGRGMGMDVVRTNLQNIRGDIRIETRQGQGTTFTLRVPLSLSVLRVMLVESGSHVFALPVDSVKSVVRLLPQDVLKRGNRELLVWNNGIIELIRPEHWLQFNGVHQPFEMEGTPTINQPVVLVVGQGDQWRGICLDRYWREQEISLRPVNSPIPLPPGFSGSTILGDGRVIPLIDPFLWLEWISEIQANPTLGIVPQADLSTKPAQTAAIAPKTHPELEKAAPPRGIASQQVHKPNKILIVDDSINVRRYLAMSLEKAGYQVEQAKDGQEAVEKLLAGLSVQAVICDIEMPRLDGYGVLSEIRARSQFKDLPIAMLTSRMNEKHRKLALNLGASAYFSKPYNEQELLKTLKQLLDNAQQGTGSA